MGGYVTDLKAEALENEAFRKVLYTSKYSQLVVMHLKSREDIGEEVHTLDQFIRCEHGAGKAIINGITHALGENMSILVPAGAKHNISNGSPGMPMKLSVLYAPPNHRDGVVHATKADAKADTEHFDGKISE